MESGNAAEPPLGGPQILVAADDDHFRGMVARALRRAGYRVLEARDPAGFWEIVGGLRDLDDELAAILTDIRMPQASGTDLATVLRRCRWSCPILFMSASAAEGDERAVRELGGTLLRKPFRMEELLLALRSEKSRKADDPATR